MMNLYEAIRSSGFSVKDFSKATGICQPVLSLIQNGKRRPTLEDAFRIEDATGGKITARFFAENKITKRQSKGT